MDGLLEAAQAVVTSLDPAGCDLDVITHSRGGLVLRTLLERPNLFPLAANRCRVGRAVLVASPNEGTPLATPDRWEQLVHAIGLILNPTPREE